MAKARRECSTQHETIYTFLQQRRQYANRQQQGDRVFRIHAGEMRAPNKEGADSKQQQPQQQRPAGHNQAHFQPQAPTAVGVPTWPTSGTFLAALTADPEPSKHWNDRARPRIWE